MKKTERKLKLFVWENVLVDYTAGMVCILAYELEHALKIANKKFPNYVVTDFAGKPYKVATRPNGFYVYGGG